MEIGGGITSGTNATLVLQKIKSSGYDPNFTIALGDLGYGDQSPKDWCGNFTNIYTRMVFIAGNHDTLNSTNAVNYNDGTRATPKDALTSEKADGLSGFLDPITGTNGYVNSCPAPSVSGIIWAGSGNNVSSRGLSCLTTLSAPSCYGREYYFDYPASNPITRFILISAGICGPWFNGCPQNATYTGWKAPTSPATCTTPSPAGSEHYCWLKSRIEEARNQGLWVAVVLHKQCIADDGNSCESTFDPFNLALQERVDLWLDGHDHTYQRSYQLSSPASDPCAATGTNGLNFQYCHVADSRPGSQPTNPYFRGNGTVVNIVGTGGAAESRICDPNTGNCSNQGYFYKLCGLNGVIANLNKTSGCSTGGDHGFSYFSVNTNWLNASFVSATGVFTDTYYVKVPNPPGDFSLHPFRTDLTVRRLTSSGGGYHSGSINLNLTSFGGLSGSINLSANVSDGLSAVFNPGPVQLQTGGIATSILTISTAPTTPCGNSTYPKIYTIIVTATGNSVTHQFSFKLTVYLQGDVNKDGHVDVADLSLIGAHFGQSITQFPLSSDADLSNDGYVNISDLSSAGSNFAGAC